MEESKIALCSFCWKEYRGMGNEQGARLSVRWSWWCRWLWLRVKDWPKGDGKDWKKEMLELKPLLFPSSPVPESTENLAFNAVSLVPFDFEKFASSSMMQFAKSWSNGIVPSWKQISHRCPSALGPASSGKVYSPEGSLAFIRRHWEMSTHCICVFFSNLNSIYRIGCTRRCVCDIRKKLQFLQDFRVKDKVVDVKSRVKNN